MLPVLVQCAGPKETERPNILWITCEDISPYLGCYGFEQAQTPNLNRLAEEGIRYTRAYANAPVCAAVSMPRAMPLIMVNPCLDRLFAICSATLLP
jgi:hypothetical protein